MKNKNLKPVAGKLPTTEQLNFPESEFSRMWKSRLIELDRVKQEHEKRWGVGRVINMVDSEFRIKFWTQQERVWAAGNSQSVEKVKAACDGMIRAYRALDAWATAEGIAPVEDVKAVEWEMDDGSVMAVVRTEQDAVAYQRARPDVTNRHIWSMQELALLLKSNLGSEVARLKAELGIPATLVKVEDAPKPAGGLSGFEDMENDIDLNEPDTMPKMFNTKAAEALKKREKR